MNTYFKSRVNDYLEEVEKIYNLHRIMVDCFSYQISTGKPSSNMFPLALIIQEKFINLEQASDKIFLDIYNK